MRPDIPSYYSGEWGRGYIYILTPSLPSSSSSPPPLLNTLSLFLSGHPLSSLLQPLSSFPFLLPLHPPSLATHTPFSSPPPFSFPLLTASQNLPLTTIIHQLQSTIIHFLPRYGILFFFLLQFPLRLVPGIYFPLISTWASAGLPVSKEPVWILKGVNIIQLSKSARGEPL